MDVVERCESERTADSICDSFMDAILMRSLPVNHPVALARVQYRTKEFPAIAHGFSGNNYRDPVVSKNSI
jgi:hypothetical protein